MWQVVEKEMKLNWKELIWPLAGGLIATLLSFWLSFDSHVLAGLSEAEVRGIKTLIALAGIACGVYFGWLAFKPLREMPKR